MSFFATSVITAPMLLLLVISLYFMIWEIYEGSPSDCARLLGY